MKNKKFEKICSMTQEELKTYLQKELQKRYEIKSENGFLYAKGDVPVLLVAHMDTVHKAPPTEFIYKGNIVSSPQGIGGDDRCGVYMILKLIEGLKCHVLFTEDEELGCVGADDFIKSSIIKDLDVNYIIEFDRQGKDDCVFYQCDNIDFINFIEETGYFKETWGTLSDISIIGPALGVAAVNLSCGYYKAHTKQEYVNLEQMEESIAQAKRIIENKCDEPFEYIENDYEMFSQGCYTHLYTFIYQACALDEAGKNFLLIRKADSVFASTKLEAIGVFMKNHRHTCYEDIEEIRMEV